MFSSTLHGEIKIVSLPQESEQANISVSPLRVESESTTQKFALPPPQKQPEPEPLIPTPELEEVPFETEPERIYASVETLNKLVFLFQCGFT